MHIPSACARDIFDNNLKALEIYRRDSIKTDVKQNKSPFAECISGVRWSC